jgi:uncharacterized protein with FMN-binding domain
MLRTYERNSRLKLTATVLAVLVVAGVVVLADHFKSQSSKAATSSAISVSTTPSNTTGRPSASSTGSTSASSPSGSYKDGTYTASGNYRVPHGSESIQVSLTLKDGVVASSSVQNSENDFDSAQFQEEFAAAYKNYVVGKKISGLQIGVIAGASDTTAGFNEALSQIASQAQA